MISKLFEVNSSFKVKSFWAGIDKGRNILVIFIFLLDLWIEIYHRIAFPLYHMPYVKRKDYIRFDRHKLSYLNLLEKTFYMYCAYANGILQYWVKIAGETEKYWCGIKHQEGGTFHAPPHHPDLAEYGDEEEYIRRYRS